MIKQRYNIDNLKPFTPDNASYYGKRGGIASGKSKMLNKMYKIRLQIAYEYLELRPFYNRKRVYKRELKNIKSIIHYIKILKNRYKKLELKYNLKYGVIPRANTEKI